MYRVTDWLFPLIVKVFIIKNSPHDFIMQEMNAQDFWEALKMHRQYLVTNSIIHLSTKSNQNPLPIMPTKYWRVIWLNERVTLARHDMYSNVMTGYTSSCLINANGFNVNGVKEGCIFCLSLLYDFHKWIYRWNISQSPRKLFTALVSS